MTDDIFIAWAAGLLEGEACFSKSLDKRTGHYACRVSVESIDIDVLKKLKSHLGGNYYENKAPSKPKHYQRSWRWQLNKQKDVYSLLSAIYIFMSARRKKRINEILEYLDNKV